MAIKLRNATDQQNWLACVQAAASILMPVIGDEQNPREVARQVGEIADAIFEEVQGRMTS